MPIVPASDFADPFVAGRTPTPEPAPEREPGGMAIAAAAFRQNNIVSSTMAYLQSAGIDDPTVGFDPLEAIRETPYAQYADRFTEATSPAQVARIKQRLDAEAADRRTIEASGMTGFAASMAAAVTDPVFLALMAIPGVGEAKTAERLATMGRAAGIGAATEIPIELALQATQDLRTAEEGALNVGAAALLSGVLGAAIKGRVPAEELAAVERTVRADMRPPDASTVGAAAVDMSTLADNTIARGGETVAQTLGKISPNLRMLTSPSNPVRQAAQELLETPFLLNKNLRGVATPEAVETRLKRSMGGWWQAYRAKRQAYGEYRARVRAEGNDPLTRAEFDRQVAFTMRRGDVSDIPEVTASAGAYRRFVYEPYKQRASRLGLLPEDVGVTGAESYLMRQYNVAKIKAEMPQWIELLKRSFQEQGAEPGEAATAAYAVTRNITGSERGTLDLDLVPTSGRFKERTLKLPDEVLEPYLVNDIDALSQAYLRSIAPQVEIVERFGDKDLKSVMDKIKDDYAILKERASSPKEMRRLADREEADLTDVAAMRDRLYGIYGSPKDPASFFVRAGRFARAYNYSRLLGGQVVSSMNDTARMLGTYGMPKMAASAVKLATNVKALNLARTSARKMAAGLEMVMSGRALMHGDADVASTFVEQRVMRQVSDAFGMATLQTPWNTVMKSWSSVMSQDDILGLALKSAEGKPLTKVQQARMASLGLDADGLRRVADQYRAKGVDEGGLRFANSDEWDDQALAQTFESAVLREVDTAVQTVGTGETPLLYSSEWGKVLLQFKSFQMSATSRLLIPMLQHASMGDMRMLSGWVALFGTSSLIYVLKQLAADQPITDDPTAFAKEVVDKSGMLAWGGEILFPALWQFGADDLSRWSDREPLETLLGPSAGVFSDAYKDRWPVRIAEGDLDEKDIHKIRRLMPFQNVFYVRRLINDLEEEAAQ